MKNLKYLLCLLLLVTFSAVAQEDTPEATEEPMAENVVLTRTALPDSSIFQFEVVGTGFFRPLLAVSPHDGTNRLLVVEQSGRVWLLKDGVMQNTPFINLANRVSQDILNGYSERGLLGLVFHPNYEENGFFFVNFTDSSGNSHVTRYSVSTDNPDIADPDSAVEILSFAQPYANHNGGNMAFGPDGYLYIGTGDGGSQNDPLDSGQNPGDLLASILRINIDDTQGDRFYRVPNDNPFFTDANVAPEVWDWGVRNPWRFSFDRITGDFYIADVGQNTWEEVNFIAAEDNTGGQNFGWPSFEGEVAYRNVSLYNPAIEPIAVYDHASGCSVTGGYVYRGEAIPELQGTYLYSDYCSGIIWGAYRDETMTWQSGVILDTDFQVSSFGEDEAGELYIVNYGGSILKIVPAG